MSLKSQVPDSLNEGAGEYFRQARDRWSRAGVVRVAVAQRELQLGAEEW